MRLASASLKLTAGALLFASTIGLSVAGPHCGRPADYKCEVPCPTRCPCLKDGFYIGVAGGYNILTANPDFDGTAGGVGVSSNIDLAVRGGDVGGFLGFGKYFDVWYLGAEVYGFWTSANTSTTVTVPPAPGVVGGTVNSRLRENGDWGIAILPGIALNNTTLGYVKVGYDWASVNARVNVTPTGGPTTTVSDNDTAHGWVFGAGIETLVCDNWSVRGQFDYINYNNDFDAQDNRISLGILYHFMF